MRSIPFCRVVAFLLLLPFAGYSQSEQPAVNEQGKTVVKANTRLVVVDVVASDSSAVWCGPTMVEMPCLNASRAPL